MLLNMKLTDLARRLNDNTNVTVCDSCYLKVAPKLIHSRQFNELAYIYYDK